ncbi:MAG: tRNA (adenosine(37)-N6)-threonylcarbamoyltransferase complex dimerization subunit type 1 TsaB [Bacteroidetes bacterium 43-16]|nr:MAG: tRNA (adenosine(37)-N6)-threonylcarbamoyltransferase complex dimerization subunit type 1 TsaB [Bacteroidetes bacterium 43-16]
MPLILFIDTAYTHTHIALGNESGILAERLHEPANEQAAVLNTLIAELLLQEGIAIKDIDAVAADGGPGSYTGLRVGIGVAKGLCFALDKPLMLFNKLTLLESGEQRFLLVLKARAGEGFAFARQDGTELMPPQHIFYEQFEWQQFEGFKLITDDVAVLETHSQAEALKSHVLAISYWNSQAQERYVRAAFDDVAYAEPFYLKSAFTTSPKKKF